ncbi:uncharacterized protein LOC135390927 [Ornithodoros turicata]|uniref:uncharacterized protein LOC135390927 n=1 Tax=Ornithodoros turicata TaxID=34597 RepID=UPI00313A3CB3
MELYTTNRRVVFIFGGPGSRKGRIVNDLAQGYGFQVVSTEKLILAHFARRISTTSAKRGLIGNMETANQVEQLLRRQPQILTLQLVLEIVMTDLEMKEQTGSTLFLLDLVPNLRSMLQVQTFIKTCDTEMEQFEREWPCLLALNLAIPENKVAENLRSLVAKSPTHLLRDGISDEKDIMKTKRRYEEYAASVREFLRYFDRNHRLATVDVSCGVADLIWARVSEFFFNLGFKPRDALNTVIFFVLRDQDATMYDFKNYRMECVDIADLVTQTPVDLEHLFDALSKYVEKYRAACECFAVRFGDLNMLEMLQYEDDRQIFFLDEKDLDHYIYTGHRGDKSNCAKLRAVCTTENHVCLFPADIDVKACKQMASLYSYARRRTRDGVSGPRPSLVPPS